MEKLSIEAIRTQLEMTQEDMAKAIGISVPTYIQKVKKRSEWKGSELNKISLIIRNDSGQNRLLIFYPNCYENRNKTEN